MAAQIVVGIVLGLSVLRLFSILRRLVDSVYGRITTGFDLQKGSRTRLDWRIMRDFHPD